MSLLGGLSPLNTPTRAFMHANAANAWPPQVVMAIDRQTTIVVLAADREAHLVTPLLHRYILIAMRIEEGTQAFQ